MAYPRGSLGSFFFGTGIGPQERIGVRVVLEIEYTGGPDRGATDVKSVTVNASPDQTQEEVLAAAVEYAESGQLGRRTGKAYPIQVVEARVEFIYQGGLEGPSLEI
jgi:hypothetical protein